MDFNKHSSYEGLHAFLGASNYHWLNYDEDKLRDRYISSKAANIGTELHSFAAQCIKLKQKLPKSKKTLNMYVNDCIGFRMKPEVLLFYSVYCFGTTDAISFRNNFLRIFDYKSGTNPAHMEQLFIYVALFCLEYHIQVTDIQIECRLYQNDECFVAVPEPEDILSIMDKIKNYTIILSKMDEEV